MIVLCCAVFLALIGINTHTGYAQCSQNKVALLKLKIFNFSCVRDYFSEFFVVLKDAFLMPSRWTMLTPLVPAFVYLTLFWFPGRNYQEFVSNTIAWSERTYQVPK